MRDEDANENPKKKIEYYSLMVTEVTSDESQKGKDERRYTMLLENGWSYRRSSKIPLFDWIEKTKDFVVTTELDANGLEKTDKDGAVKRSFRSPNEDDWTLLKTKTEDAIDKSGKTVGEFIYDALLQNPSQKVRGQLVRVVERKFYKDELKRILKVQQTFYPELNDRNLYTACMEELYANNEVHRRDIFSKDIVYLLMDDIIFYQRPLKSKVSQIRGCRFEEHRYKDENGVWEKKTVPCIAKSHPLFQAFRLWQWIRNLQVYKRDNDEVPVTDEFLKTEQDYVHLFDFLNDRKDITQDVLLRFLVERRNLKGKALTMEVAKYRWNLVDDKDKKYPCNETRSQMIARLEKCSIANADFLTRENEEALWHILYSATDKTELEKALRKFGAKCGVGEEFVKQFQKHPPYVKDYGSYSAKAIKKLLPLMCMGKYWSEAAIPSCVKERIIKMLTGEYDENIEDKVRERVAHLVEMDQFRGLPLWLASYIVYGRHAEASDLGRWKTPEELDEFLRGYKQYSLRNPIVEQVVTETLRVVSDIWKEYGDGAESFFDEIHVELGREMKNPADKRKSMTEKVNDNENTNLRIKALLMEMMHAGDVENVRPYSPMQQEILKIYEEYAISNEEEYDESRGEFVYSPVPDDIIKINKMSQPSHSDIVRYKLWLEQRYRSPYTGCVIPLHKLFTPAYEIEHIIPQSRYFDDSFSNKVICEAEVNKLKGNMLAMEFIQQKGTQIVALNWGKTAQVLSEEAYLKFVKEHYPKASMKRKKLELLDLPEAMIERQMNDTRYISNEVKNLLSKIVRSEVNDDGVTSKNLITTNGQITTALKRDWGLDAVWNEIVSERFVRMNEMTGNSGAFGKMNPATNKFLPSVPLEYQKGFSKKRIDHRHHAMDALVIACATRSHINYMNNQHALEKGKTKEQKQRSREDLRHVLCSKKYGECSTDSYRWMFKAPWDTFAHDSREHLLTTIVSFKQNLRVLTKTVNMYAKWQRDDSGKLRKVKIKQETGEHWAIRKPLHKDTVSGLVCLRFKKMVALSIALDNWQMIVNKSLKNKIKELVLNYRYDKKLLTKFFKDRGNTWKDQDISRVEIYYFDNENAASRVLLDGSFDSKKLKNITDGGIQRILLKHLQKYNTQEGKERPKIAFSPEGLDVLNRDICELNNGVFHQPIYRVHTYEPKGNKFAVGHKACKKNKYVEAAKGTNLYFAIYIDKEGKRTYRTIPLNEVVENLKDGYPPVNKQYVDKKGNEYQLLFWLSPNDLVYVPTEEERGNPQLVNVKNLTKDQVERVYKAVSFTGSECYFVRHDIAAPIVNKFEFSSMNKMERAIDGVMAKEVCWKLTINRIGGVCGDIRR